MAETLTTFDPAEGLTSDEAGADLMEEAVKAEDVGDFAHALGCGAGQGYSLCRHDMS